LFLTCFLPDVRTTLSKCVVTFVSFLKCLYTGLYMTLKDMKILFSFWRMLVQ